jgi:hypothetical protein
MGAAADCEAIGAGFLGQPVNGLTTLGFVVAGMIVIIRRRDMRWIGIGLIATGIGSFLFHGPMPPGNEWAHDVTLAWLAAIVAGLGTRWERLTHLPALLIIGALVALAPVLADPLAVALTVAAVLSILRQDRSATTIAPLMLLAVLAVFGRLGATGGPLCDPGSLLQPHAVWHLGAAAAVAWWALSSPGEPQLPRGSL